MTREQGFIRRNPLQQQLERGSLDFYAKPQIVRSPKNALDQITVGR